MQTGELRKNGLKVRLQEKSFRILSALLEHPGQLVTREFLWWRRHWQPPLALMQTLSLSVFFFEQTAQASTCQTFQRPGVTQVRCRAKKWRTAAACQAFRPDCRQPYKSALGELHNESRNDFDYRPGCVFAWWRRLVLGARARLTRPVLERK
jgi:hypothetical protein